MSTEDSAAPLRVTEISQFIQQHSCERWLRLAYNQREAAEEVPFYERLFNPLDPVLQQRGRMREDEWADSLRQEGAIEINDAIGGDYDSFESPPVTDEGVLAVGDEVFERDSEGDQISWSDFRSRIGGLERGQDAFAREVEISGHIGAFEVTGRIDFLLVRWTQDGAKIRVVETKNSRKDRTSHRIQVGVYTELIEEKLSERPLRFESGLITGEDVEGVVGRIDETTNEIEDILSLEPLDLSQQRSDVRRLLNPEGRVSDILSVEPDQLDELDYRLEPKCDQCVFDVHCFPETARRRGLELISIPPSTVRVIENEGIETLDELAALDLDSPEADRIRSDQSVREELSILVAQARARIQNLPEPTVPEVPDVDGYPVISLQNRNQSQLPSHQQEGQPLIRVYLNVDYDYVEDRIVALAAHITNSTWYVETPFEEDSDGNFKPDPELVETPPETSGGDVPGHIDGNVGDTRQVRGSSVIEPRTRPWSGDYVRDTETESQLIERFLHELIDEIIEISREDRGYVHLYVWSESELQHLVDACARGGTQLLHHLRQLLGCREPTEQLIYSSLQNEIANRYAPGWTGRGLVVLSSLNWFGDLYHWRRDVAGTERDLERIFEQDLFDYKTTLGLNEDGTWSGDRDRAERVERFEIRSRYFDNLPLGYLHQVWNELPDVSPADDSDAGVSNRTASVIERYQRADRRDLKAYLEARTIALRWFDEHIRPKNDEITKVELNLPELDQYELGVHDTARAALDFLLLDHSVKISQWFADNLQAVSDRVPDGKAIPLSDVRFTYPGGDLVEASLDFDEYDIGIDQFRRRTSFEPGNLVRVCPYSGGPNDGPTFGQLRDASHAFRIERYDWEEGEISLEPLYWPANRYRLRSRPNGDPGEPLFEDNPDMVIVESVSDHPAGHVHRRLTEIQRHHVFDWFDLTSPEVPGADRVSEGRLEAYENLLLDHIDLGDGDSLMQAQADAALDGLQSRVHMIHGPPGTGKTTTTAIAILMRILHRREEGDRLIITGSTHQAVNTLLERVESYLDLFDEAARNLDFTVPDIEIVKVTSSEPNPDNAPEGDIEVFAAESNFRRWNRLNDGTVLLIGGTVSAVLKDFRDLDGLASIDSPYQVPELVVDEASMMVFPHFLALSTVVGSDGHILLAGDHRQLSPIVAHEWEEEDRPPVQIYQPYKSAFEAVRDIESDPTVDDSEVSGTRLQYTFRLPPAIRALVRRLYRDRDDLELQGEMADEIMTLQGGYDDPLESVWDTDIGLFLVTHDERESRLSNDFEASLIRRILGYGHDLPENSVAVLTPHTAQRSNLELELGDQDDAIGVVDTVERLQGDEAQTIIVSATASDPTAISSNEEFLLNLNRANVAFSRSQRRLIVVCSRTFLDHIPPEIEEYNSAMLWKSLRDICTLSVGEETVDGHEVEVFIPDPESEELQEVIDQNGTDQGG